MNRARLLKFAGSRLREGISVEADPQNNERWNVIHQDRLSGRPRFIGNLHVGNDDGVVHESVIAPEFQGTGAARKAYGEVARRMPGGQLLGDHLQTPGSFGLWSGAMRQHLSDSIAGKKNTFEVLPTSGGYTSKGGIFYRAHGDGHVPNWIGTMPEQARILHPAAVGRAVPHPYIPPETAQALEKRMRESIPIARGGPHYLDWESAIPLNGRRWAESNARQPGHGSSFAPYEPIPYNIPEQELLLPGHSSKRTNYNQWSQVHPESYREYKKLPPLDSAALERFREMLPPVKQPSPISEAIPATLGRPAEARRLAPPVRPSPIRRALGSIREAILTGQGLPVNAPAVAPGQFVQRLVAKTTAAGVPLLSRVRAAALYGLKHARI